MTLRDAILSNDIEERNERTTQPLIIEYRLFLPIRFGDDSIFMGMCKYENGFLTSCDGDDYSLNDVINGFKYDKVQDILMVYQETSWN